jgi:hypothetical protein
MSKRFLDSSPSKLLILAGVDRLDTELEIGRVCFPIPLTRFHLLSLHLD